MERNFGRRKIAMFSMEDWSRINMEEELRGASDKEKVEKIGMINIIMKNNIKLLEMQKTIKEIKGQREREIRRREEEKIREQEEIDKWIEECRKRNDREREEKEEPRRVDKEWRRIEGIRRREEKRAEKEWKYQEIRERRREMNR